MELKKRFKLFSIVVASITLISTLTSCNSNANDDHGLDANNPTTIKMWHYYNGVQQNQFDKLVNEFNETVGYEKGIIIEASSSSSVSELSDNVISALNNNVGSDEIPDIFASYAETAYIADNLGYVADMKKYFTDDELSEYIDEYIDEGSFSNDDTLKIFPIAKSTEVMVLNLTDWQKFADATGVTTDDLKTWESLVDVSEKYYNYTDNLTPDIPNDGKAFFGRDSSANYMVVGAKQLGCEYVKVVDGKNTLDLDKDAIRKLWDNYYVPYVKGYYTSESRYRSDDAKIGKLIALVGSTSGSAYYPTEVTIDDDYTYPIESLVLPVPNFEGYDPYIVQQGAGFVVTKSDDTKEYACSVFLKWFTDATRNIEFSINSGYLPVKKEANDFEKISEINNNSENPISTTGTLIDTIKVAIDEINTSTLYASKPYQNCDSVRDLLGEFIQDKAVDTYKEASTRIANGENRDTVIDEYTNDTAFENWYTDFENQITETAITD